MVDAKLERVYVCDIHVPDGLFKYNVPCKNPSSRRIYVLEPCTYYYRDISNNTIIKQSDKQAQEDMTRVFDQDGGSPVTFVNETNSANIIIFPDHHNEKQVRLKYQNAICIPYAIARNQKEINLQPLEEMKAYTQTLKVLDPPKKQSLKKTKKKSLRKKSLKT